MKEYLLNRMTIGLTVLLMAGSWFMGCSPSGVSSTDESTESIESMPTPQYPLSVNRIVDADQTSIEN